jgi:hypothetical protein
MTVDGVWVGDSLYWPLIHTSRSYKQLQRHRYFHNSGITVELIKPFPDCCIFTSNSLAMAYNSGDSSASHAQVLSSQPPCGTACFLTSDSQPFHTNLIVFSSMHGCQLTTGFQAGRHFTPTSHFSLHSPPFNWELNYHWLFSSDFRTELTWLPQLSSWHSLAWHAQRAPFILCCMCIHCHGNVFTEPLPRNGHC